MKMKAIWKRINGKEEHFNVADERADSNYAIGPNEVERAFWEDSLKFHQDALKTSAFMLNRINKLTECH